MSFGEWFKEWLVPSLERRDPEMRIAKEKLESSFRMMDGTTNEIQSRQTLSTVPELDEIEEGIEAADELMQAVMGGSSVKSE